ncbi:MULTISPECIES: nucleotidyltransferase domain-containing protein [Providencia]|uniref:nucleotidyltransferase domain-containing protein n=1 Tax=Providencia TaxID=586 RepID=UPI0001C34798|nr:MULTISPECIES: nucleotidyltransferase domain-containing protein [Providencia]QKG45537.1 nucleotidyltransferase domain-containing protein [Providencia rettgeri]QNN31773.1 nucleotidyltransferase domain-containing protein [Providencia rettgeri]QXA56516.1 nucleotidyltransferase domain-containing protein [Providencia rettgeri]
MKLKDYKYIPVPEERPFQPEFQSIITESIYWLSCILKDKLHSIYVYGSVAKGCAKPQQSDLDLCIILCGALTQLETTRLNEIQVQLTVNHIEVSKIDFDIGILTDVMSEANLYSWGYWIKHHCRCIYGYDLATHFSQFVPSREIAEAVNGDFVNVLNDYIDQINHCHDDSELKLLYRAASRKLIRSTNILRWKNDSDWPETLFEYIQKFVQYYPERQNEINYFLRQSIEPFADEEFLKYLAQFISWLDVEHSNVVNK